MQNKDNSRIKKILIVAILVVVLAFFLINIFKCKKETENINMVVIEPAPQSTLNPQAASFESRKSFKDSNGKNIEYYQDENGNIHILKDGKEYIVRPDGSVWQVNEDGTLTKIEGEEASKILETARQIANQDSLVASSINQSNLAEKTKLKDLTDEQLKVLAEELGIDYNYLKGLRDKARAEGSDMTIQDLIDMANNQKASEKSQKEKELEQLAAYLKGMGITDISPEELYDRIHNSGMTVDEFLQQALHDGVNTALKNLGYEVAPDTDQALFDALVGSDIITKEDGSKWKRNADGTLTRIDENEKDPYDKMIEAMTSGNDTDLSYLGDAIKTESSYTQQNNQAGKSNFVKSFQNGTEVISTKPKSNMIVNGTVINAILVSGINTDLPSSSTIAIVSENVYDNFSHSNILIPKGSKLIGSYDSSVTWGQTRVLIVWTQVIREDGTIIKLNGYNGTDSLGYTGIAGSVNNHIGNIVGASALSSLINIGTGYLSTASDKSLTSAIKNLASSVGTSSQTVAENFLSKEIDRQPTITIPNGTRITIIANDNVELPVYKKTKGVTWK